MKKSELRRIIKECMIEEASLGKSLEDVSGSLTKFLKDNLDTIAILTNNPAKLKTYLEKEMKSLKVSDEYSKKFFMDLDTKKSGLARLQFITNTMLAGMKLGVIK